MQSGLSSLGGLENLSLLGGLDIQDGNPDLTGLAGLGPVDRVAGNLGINGSALVDLSGLGTIQHIDGSLTLRDNPNLARLDGLDQLVSVFGGLSIRRNTSLADLEGLGALTGVGGTVDIGENGGICEEELDAFAARFPANPCTCTADAGCTISR